MMELSRFRSDAYAEKDRLAVLHDVYSAVERVDIDITGDQPVLFDVATRTLPEVTVLEPTIPPMSRRSRAPVNGRDDIVLAFVIDGHVSFSPHGGTDLELAAGEAYLGYNTRASRHNIYGKPRFLNISISRAVMKPLVADLDEAAKSKLPQSRELALLRNYAQMLMRGAAGPISPELAARCSNHLVDLATIVLGARAGAGEFAVRRGIRHAMLAAIKGDIETNLTQPWLSLEATARRHAVSPQYLRTLFHKDGTSFSDFVRDRKLDRAYRMLTTFQFLHRGMGDVAYDCGFADPAHFNLAFQRRFSITPAEARTELWLRRLG